VKKGLLVSLLDSEIGEVHLNLSDLKDGYPTDKWFDVKTKKDKVKGQLRVQIMYITDGTNGEEFTRPLHVLMTKNKFDLFERALSDPVVDLEALDDAGRTALLLAAATNKLKYVEALVKKEVKLNDQKNPKGQTALHLACVHKASKDLISFLLKKKANQTIKDTDNESTALHLAAAEDHLPAVEALLADKKANVNATNKNGQTPLVEALLHGATHVIRVRLWTSCCSIVVVELTLCPLPASYLLFGVVFDPEGSRHLCEEWAGRECLGNLAA